MGSTVPSGAAATGASPCERLGRVSDVAGPLASSVAAALASATSVTPASSAAPTLACVTDLQTLFSARLLHCCHPQRAIPA